MIVIVIAHIFAAYVSRTQQTVSFHFNVMQQKRHHHTRVYVIRAKAGEWKSS